MDKEKADKIFKEYFSKMDLAGGELTKATHGYPIGQVFVATGHFLLDNWNNHMDDKEKKGIEKIRKKLNKIFDEQGHSGTSAVVTTAIFLGEFNKPEKPKEAKKK